MRGDIAPDSQSHHVDCATPARLAQSFCFRPARSRSARMLAAMVTPERFGLSEPPVKVRIGTSE